MDFISAVRTGLPIRRKAWKDYPLIANYWISLKADKVGSQGCLYCWRLSHDNEEYHLSPQDYTTNDWEVGVK